MNNWWKNKPLGTKEQFHVCTSVHIALLLCHLSKDSDTAYRIVWENIVDEVSLGSKTHR